MRDFIAKCHQSLTKRFGRNEYDFLLAFITALTVQLLFIIATLAEHAFNLPLVDSAGYHDVAINPYSVANKAYWQPPLYVWLLRCIYRLVSPENAFAVRFMHGVVGAFAAALTGLLAHEIFGISVIIPAILLSIYGPFLFYSTQLLPAVPATMLFLVSIYFLLLLRKTHLQKHSLLCGISTGLSALTVANFLTFVPIQMIVILANKTFPSTKKKTVCLFLFLGGIAVCILPVAIRNRIAGGEWFAISTNAGINLYIGNNPSFEETMAVRPGVDWLRLMNKPRREGAKTAKECDKWFVKKALAYVASHPVSFFYATLKKVAFFMNGYELPRNTSIYSYRQKSPFLAALVWRTGSFSFPFSVLLPFFLLGFVVCSGKNSSAKILLAFIVVYSLSVILFFPSDRYRLPVIPVMLIFAVAGVQQLVNSIDIRRKLITVLLPLISGVALSVLPINFPTNKIPFDAELDVQIGGSLLRRNKPAEAFSFFESALDKEPDLAEAWYFYGVGLLACEKFSEAKEKFQTCLACRPDHERALHDLAFLLAMENKQEESAALFEEVLKIDPYHTGAMKNLGIIRIKQGRVKEANELLHKAGVLPNNMEIILRLNKSGRPQPFLKPINVQP